jgi:hypothetical protein
MDPNDVAELHARDDCQKHAEALAGRRLTSMSVQGVQRTAMLASVGCSKPCHTPPSICGGADLAAQAAHACRWIGVATLADPGFLIDVEAIAVFD